jgi:cell division protein ZapA
MAQVTLDIGGRRYDLACRDGEEAHLTRLAALVDAKALEAEKAIGQTTEARRLLLAALLLADELADGGKVALPDPDLADRLERIAARMEAIAQE